MLFLSQSQAADIVDLDGKFLEHGQAFGGSDADYEVLGDDVEISAEPDPGGV